MSSIAETYRLPGIGHNGGPTLTNRWAVHCWRRAHRAALRTPDRSVIDLRLRRARAAGLDYRQYTSMLLENGRGPAAALIRFRPDWDAAPAAHRSAVLSKLGDIAALTRIGLAVGMAETPFERLRGDCKGAVDHWCRLGSSVGASNVIMALLKDLSLPPSAAFLVGSRNDDCRLSERARLAAFVPANLFFTFAEGGVA